MSTAPAFSPGPWTTRGPFVGSVFRWSLLLLYEQCSDHITEKRPSSVRFGSRPRCFLDPRVFGGGEAVLGEKLGGDEPSRPHSIAGPAPPRLRCCQVRSKIGE